MKVLLAVYVPKERQRLHQMLSLRGHDVLSPEPADVQQRLLEGDADVALVQHGGSQGWLETAAGSDNARLHVIALTAKLNGQTITDVLAAGAHDFTRLRACPEEVLARVDLPKRLREQHIVEDPLSELIAWSDAPQTLSQEIGEMFGLFLSAQPAQPAPLAIASEITATCVVDGVEVRLAAGLTEAAQAQLSQIVFGEPVSRSLLSDCVGEIANTIGGAFKRAALAEGKTFSIGLPSGCPTEAPGVGDQTWIAGGEELSVHVSMTSAVSAIRQVSTCSLRPGMVLRHDVYSPSGTLMVKSGTALTDRTTEKLINLCGEGAMLEVLFPQLSRVA